MVVVGKEDLDFLVRSSHELGQCKVPAEEGRWLISYKTNQEWLSNTPVTVHYLALYQRLRIDSTVHTEE